MGYYTDYSIKLDPWPSEDPDERISLVCSMNLDGVNTADGWCTATNEWIAMRDLSKWYGHSEDLRVASLARMGRVGSSTPATGSWRGTHRSPGSLRPSTRTTWKR